MKKLRLFRYSLVFFATALPFITNNVIAVITVNGIFAKGRLKSNKG
jgi:hypothetical protein